VLKNGTLSYYVDQNLGGGDAKGSIEITAKTQIRLFTDMNVTPEGRYNRREHPQGFEIYQGSGFRTYYFDAGTRQKLIAWVHALEDVIEAKNEEKARRR